MPRLNFLEQAPNLYSFKNEIRRDGRLLGRGEEAVNYFFLSC